MAKTRLMLKFLERLRLRKSNTVCPTCGLTTCRGVNDPGVGNTYRCPLRFAMVLAAASKKLEVGED